MEGNKLRIGDQAFRTPNSGLLSFGENVPNRATLVYYNATVSSANANSGYLGNVHPIMRKNFFIENIIARFVYTLTASPTIQRVSNCWIEIRNELSNNNPSVPIGNVTTPTQVLAAIRNNPNSEIDLNLFCSQWNDVLVAWLIPDLDFSLVNGGSGVLTVQISIVSA